MKKISIIKIVSSNNFTFVFAIMGSIVESWHTYHTVLLMSDLPGIQKYLQAVVAALFIGGGLLTFVVRSGGLTKEDSYDRRSKYKKTINMFTGISIVINLYYWCSIIYFNESYHQLVIAIPFSITIPLIIKSYAGEIKEKYSSEVSNEYLKIGDNIALQIGNNKYNGTIKKSDFKTE